MNRVKGFNYFYIVSLMIGLSFFSGILNCHGDELNSFTGQGKPVLKTEKEIIQGKKNVKSVVAQLKALLLPSSRLKQLKKQRIAIKPYSKVIKGSDNRSTLIYRCRYV